MESQIKEFEKFGKMSGSGAPPKDLLDVSITKLNHQSYQKDLNENLSQINIDDKQKLMRDYSPNLKQQDIIDNPIFDGYEHQL